MKQKGIKRLFRLIPMMIACFTLLVVGAMTVKTQPTVAEESTSVAYPFKTGVNALENGRLFTVPTEVAGDWSEIWYKSEGATAENPYYPTLSTDGYLAFQIATDKEVGIYFKAYDPVTGSLPLYAGTTYFMDETGSVSQINDGGLGGVIPANAQGAVILALNGFQGVNLSTVQLFTLNIHDYYAGANVKLGALGYYENNTTTEMNSLTSASVNTEWTITLKDNATGGSIVLPNIEAVSETVAYEMRTGEDAFAYGKLWNGIDNKQDAWPKTFYYFDNGETKSLDGNNGYLAMQMETDKLIGLYITVFDGTAEYYLPHGSTAYFVSEEGVASTYTSNSGNLEIVANSRGVIILPLANLVSNSEAVMDWTQVELVSVMIDCRFNFGFNLKLGELGYYANNTAEMVKITTLNTSADSKKIVYGAEGFGSMTMIQKSSLSVKFVNDDNTEIASYNQNSGVAVVKPETDPVKDGYLFKGWYVNDKKFDFTAPIYDDVVIKAKYATGIARYVSISTAGDIGLIFYVEMPNDSTDQVVGTLTVEGVDGGTEVNGIYREKQGCFAFIASVLPKDYKKEVTLTIGGEAVAKTSVEKYATQLATAENVAQEAKDLGAALITYCEAVRVFFDDNETVDEKVEFTTDLSAWAGNQTDNEGDVTIKGATLTVKSTTTINVYFTTEEAIEEIEFSNNVTVSKVEGQENVYVASVQNILARNLDQAYTVKIGEDEVTYSAISYAYTNIANDDTSAELYNLSVALYHYSEAANAFFRA